MSALESFWSKFGFGTHHTAAEPAKSDTKTVHKEVVDSWNLRAEDLPFAGSVKEHAATCGKIREIFQKLGHPQPYLCSTKNTADPSGPSSGPFAWEMDVTFEKSEEPVTFVQTIYERETEPSPERHRPGTLVTERLQMFGTEKRTYERTRFISKVEQ